jgi:hypothetical protein
MKKDLLGVRKLAGYSKASMMPPISLGFLIKRSAIIVTLTHKSAIGGLNSLLGLNG